LKRFFDFRLFLLCPLLIDDPYAWRWSSAKAHGDGIHDIFSEGLSSSVDDWGLEAVSEGFGRRGGEQDSRP
jgi:hypothetical protein